MVEYHKPGEQPSDPFHNIPNADGSQDKLELICFAVAWPYTENNICILAPHDGEHEDAKGRKFTHAGYPDTARYGHETKGGRG